MKLIHEETAKEPDNGNIYCLENNFIHTKAKFISNSIIAVEGDDIEINSVSPHYLHSVHDRSQKIHNFFPPKVKKVSHYLCF